MPSKKQYDLVQNDEYDTRVPLHSEEAFHHGITFQAKLIGCLDVQRPTSRVEIVAAMRRIRYEFKAKGVKKKKVTIEISIDGVKITLRKKKKRKSWPDDEKSTILSHPIYRIFYVSHDSQDMKIFSYIARDGASNIFKCAVFKSNKKSQAMRVVRTIGQAFEVCHKLSITAPENDQDEQETLTQDLLSDRLSDVTSNKSRKDYETDLERLSLPGFDEDNQETKPAKNTTKQTDFLTSTSKNINNNKPSSFVSTTIEAKNECGGTNEYNISGLTSSNQAPGSSDSNLSAHHEIQLLREQLEQQNQQTQAAVAQIQLLREQLAVEQGARMEAQSRTHQLLVHNRELLDHISALVSHLQSGSSDKSGGQQQNVTHVTLPQLQTEVYPNDLPLPPPPPLQQDNCMENFNHFIENRAVASHLPQSPLKPTFPTTSTSMFNFPYDYENQLYSSLQSGYSPTPPHTSYPQNPYNYNPYFIPPYYSSSNLMNNDFGGGGMNYYHPRHSFGDNNQRIHGVGGIRHSSEPRQFPHQYYNTKHYPNYSHLLQNEQNDNTTPQNTQNVQRHQQQQGSNLIKPLSQMRNLSTTNDSDGRVKVIVPSSQSNNNNNSINENKQTEGLLSNLRLNDNFRMNGPSTIQRSTSEKVPHRSELMSQMQRSIWARHTTK